MISMKSMIPFMTLGAMMSGGMGGGGNYLDPHSEYMDVPEKLKNIPKPLSRKQKAKLKAKNKPQ